MIFDVLVLIVILISAITAFLRGFIREVLTIIGVLGGLLASFFGGPFLMGPMFGWLGVSRDHAKVDHLFGFIPMDMVATIAAYGLIFVVVVVVLSVLSYFLASGAKAMGLGPADRALGVVFGLVRAALLLSLLYLPVYSLTSVKDRDHWAVFKHSKTRFYVEHGAAWLAGFLPEGAEKTAAEKTKQAAATAHKIQDAVQTLQNTKPDDTTTPADNTEGYRPIQREKLDSLIRENQ